MTKFTLMEYLFSAISFPRTWKSNCGKEVYGHLLTISRNGSGSSFNLLVIDENNVQHSISIRTID